MRGDDMADFTPNPQRILTSEDVILSQPEVITTKSGSTLSGEINEFEPTLFSVTWAEFSTWANDSDVTKHRLVTLKNGNYIEGSRSGNTLTLYCKKSDNTTLYNSAMGLNGYLWRTLLFFETEKKVYAADKASNNKYYIMSESSMSAISDFFDGAIPSSDIIGTGGGATHIAKVTGLLSTLSSNLSDILAVAGGGGGGLLSDSVAYNGKEAGGISGSGANSGNQSSGYAFGEGESSSRLSGGGGGLYGGLKGTYLEGGGAGSGYIGNALLSNKKMVGYNVPTSSAESTKTESVQAYSADAEANKPKAGDGFAKITFRRKLKSIKLDSYLSTHDFSNSNLISANANDGVPFSAQQSTFEPYLGTSKNLRIGRYDKNFAWDSSEQALKNLETGTYKSCFYAIPLPQRIEKPYFLKFKGKFDRRDNTYCHVGVGQIYNNVIRQTKWTGSVSSGVSEWDVNTYEELIVDRDDGGTSDLGYTFYHMGDMEWIDYLVLEINSGIIYLKDIEILYDDQ